MIVDLRSDTFTKPTSEMLEAMFAASVGDDVFEEDPTVNALEEKTAAYFGFEKALFCASGTMANQVAISTHTGKGDEVICESNSHVYYYEGGAIAAMAGASVRTILGTGGMLTAHQIATNINPDNIHHPKSKLISLENTCNRGGGACYNWNELQAIKTLAREKDIPTHLDGARIWNAIIKNNENPTDYANVFDSMSLCFSKGLGAPVGSVLVGNAEFIKKARRVRKRFGGAWRQAGYLAAACVYALDHHVDRISLDHNKAMVIGEYLQKIPSITKVLPIHTNIILLETDTVAALIDSLANLGIKCLPFGPNTIRMLTHLDITDEHMNYLLDNLKKMR